jgi:hypothetical protein
VKRLTLTALLALVLIGCNESNEPDYGCPDVGNTADDSRPDILVIGDSISIGYTTPLRESLGADIDVVHNECNAMYSANGVRKIDSWLAQRESFEVVTFNHGLWDIADWIGGTGPAYRENIRYVARRIKAKTARPYFVTTTEVLPGTPGRTNAKVEAYNAIALEVMAEEGIPVIDLYAASLMIRTEHVSPDDVHFTDAGSRFLADVVLAELNL